MLDESSDLHTDCATARMWLSLRIDHEELPPGTEATLGEHLRACKACVAWEREETERSERLRAALAVGESTDTLEAAIVLAARRSGFDEETLGPRRRARVLPIRSWRGALVLAAAAGLLAGVAVLTYSRWPDGRREVASTGSNTIGQLLPIPTWSGSANEDDGGEPLPPTVHDVRVVQGADGQPVGIRLRRESVAYQLDVERAPDGTPAVTAASQEDGATAADPRSFRPGRLRLQVERVTPVFLPLRSWPYE